MHQVECTHGSKYVDCVLLSPYVFTQKKWARYEYG